MQHVNFALDQRMCLTLNTHSELARVEGLMRHYYKEVLYYMLPLVEIKLLKVSYYP
jgi:hypothetical protein